MTYEIIEDFNEVSTHIPRDLISLLLDDKRSDDTKRAYSYDINRFFLYLTGHYATSDNVQKFLSLSKTRALEIVIAYKNRLITHERLSESTINRRISAIRSLVKLGKTLGYCDYDLNEVKLERVQNYRDTSGIDLNQFKRMLEVPNRETLKGKRDFAILLLLFETALRRGELTKIKLKDYQPESKVVWVMGKGKGTQKESITISNQIIKIIEDYLEFRGTIYTMDPESPLFATTDRRTAGSSMSGEAVRRLVRDIAIEAGIEKPMSPHKIRHSAITIALDETNGDVRSVQKLSRHKKMDTLLVYDDNRQNKQGEITQLLSSLI